MATWLRAVAAAESGLVRSAAVRAAATYSGIEVPVGLREAYVLDDDPGVRVSAIRAMAEVAADDPDVAAVLRRVASTDDYWRARQVAIQVAAVLPASPELAAWITDCARSDAHWTVRQVAIETLAERWPSDPGTRTLLADRASADPDPDLRELAARLRDAAHPVN